jgi:aminoglycoside 3-N-acetyltransferase
MSKLGWVVGGAQAVIEALLAAVGPEGTIMMVTNSSHNTDPANWRYPPVPESWWPTIRDHMPAYQPQCTPTRGLGVVPELFRTWPGAVRSPHPAYSLTAVGRQADLLMAEHLLHEDLGERSPLGKLYELDGYVLLLGVGHGNNTTLHMAEWRADYPGKQTHPSGSAMLVNGRREWVAYHTLKTSDDDFDQIGAAFDAAHQIEIGRIHQAEARFFKQRLAVDFAVKWIEANRT